MLGRNTSGGIFFLQCTHKEVGVSKAGAHRQSQNNLTRWWDELQPSSLHPVPMGSPCEETGCCGSPHHNTQQQLRCCPCPFPYSCHGVLHRPVGPEHGSCLEAAFPCAGSEAVDMGTVGRTLCLSRWGAWDSSVPQQQWEQDSSPLYQSLFELLR